MAKVKLTSAQLAAVNRQIEARRKTLKRRSRVTRADVRAELRHARTARRSGISRWLFG